MSGKSGQPPARTKDETQVGNAGAQVEVRRAMRTAIFNEDARRLVAWGKRNGLIAPAPGGREWKETIEFAVLSGLIRRPNNKRKADANER